MTTDGGRTWEKASLTGKVDKFFLSDGVLYAKAGYVMRYEGQPTGRDEAKVTGSFLHSEITHTFDQGDLSISFNLLEPSPVRLLFLDNQGSTITKHEIPRLQGRHSINVALVDKTHKVLVLTDPELYLIDLDSRQL